MKLTITEAEPGELAARAPEIVRALERLTGQRLLAMDEPLAKSQAAGTSAPSFTHPVLDETVKRSAKQVRRIRKLMEAKFAEVVEG